MSVGGARDPKVQAPNSLLMPAWGAPHVLFELERDLEY
jgi:hypothetical protein